MNVLIIDSWLREFLKTKATPKEIAEYLSLCSQSVEKIKRINNDFLYEIEVTTNRTDCFSVYGIARELKAILSCFGIKTSLFQLDLENFQIPKVKNPLPLKVEIANVNLCPRFTAIIFDQVKVSPSPKIIQDRLEKCNIRALNNVVDISNYLMLETGQPMHTFDYDKIKRAKMLLREARKGEIIITLDGKKRSLPKGAIVIEDGEGRLIDLCGIMGGENSAVDQKTKRVLLFVQAYDPSKIRQTSQKLAFRTEASSRFEKGVNPEGVLIAIKRAIKLFEENCNAKVASEIIDIYPNPLKRKIVKFNSDLINKTIGIKIPHQKIVFTLESLGFKISSSKNKIFICEVPPWRYQDISIPEDIIEEIARIYGYHNLPSIIPKGIMTEKADSSFNQIQKIKTALKYWGFTEILSYSMVSEDLLLKTGFSPKNYLKISNPLTLDLVFMRPSLIPSILQIISKNQANFQDIKIFEIANIYIPKGENSLPEEIPMLTIALTGDKFYELKGTIERLFEDLGIPNYEFISYDNIERIFTPGKTAEIKILNNPVGLIGEISPSIIDSFKINSQVFVVELKIPYILKNATFIKQFKPISPFPPIIEDLAFQISKGIEIGKILNQIKKINPFISDVQILDTFNHTYTFRIFYQSYQKTLSSNEIKEIREKIIKTLQEKFQVVLKS